MDDEHVMEIVMPVLAWLSDESKESMKEVYGLDIEDKLRFFFTKPDGGKACITLVPDVVDHESIKHLETWSKKSDSERLKMCYTYMKP